MKINLLKIYGVLIIAAVIFVAISIILMVIRGVFL